MKSESTEIDLEETEQDLIDDEEVEPVYQPDFEDITQVRHLSIQTAMEFWSTKAEIQMHQEEIEDSVIYPAHITTILDTAKFIENFYLGNDS